MDAKTGRLLSGKAGKRLHELRLVLKQVQGRYKVNVRG